MPDEITLQLPAEPESALTRLIAEDALGQLLSRSGRMRELATEGDDVKLDWLAGVEQALAKRERLAAVETEAAAIARLGIRYVIWAGMGGSVQTVYALARMGFVSTGAIRVFPLDSTDPATLNVLLGRLAEAEGLALPASGPIDAATLRPVLDRTLMMGVSMGMTSEEPITHLEWFDGLLREAGVAEPSDHIQVMTLPGSYLDNFARARGSRMTPIQLDSQNHTAGRMSAPATRVFLRPVALRLMGDALAAGETPACDGGLLAAGLGRAQRLGGVSTTLSAAARAEFVRTDAFTRLAAWLSEAAASGRNKPLVLLPAGWEGFAPWLEQLVEESLGKDGKGLLIFYDQGPAANAAFGPDVVTLEVRVGGRSHADAARLPAGGTGLVLDVPEDATAAPAGLAEVAALCLGFERMVAVFGYLQGIVFAGQPAVEAYKRYARELREAPAPVRFESPESRIATHGSLTLYYETPLQVGLVTPDALAAELAALGATGADAAGVIVALVRIGRRAGWLRYLDFTFNGELAGEARAAFDRMRVTLANETLGIPGKLRTGPSDYHSTEQSETAGPAELLSIRWVALEHEPIRVGRYSDKFLLAQARGTWQAMADAGRPVLMVTLPALNVRALADVESLCAACAQGLGHH